MAIENLNNQHYKVEAKNITTASLTAIENALSDQFKNITAQERLRYGSVNEQNKLFINKVRDFKNTQPNLSSPDIDWQEFQNDYESREFLQSTIARLESLLQSLKNNKILHDFDNYKDALTDYDYCKYKLKTKVNGYEIKTKELAQFFHSTKSKILKKDDMVE